MPKRVKTTVAATAGLVLLACSFFVYRGWAKGQRLTVKEAMYAMTTIQLAKVDDCNQISDDREKVTKRASDLVDLLCVFNPRIDCSSSPSPLTRGYVDDCAEAVRQATCPSGYITIDDVGNVIDARCKFGGGSG